MAVEITLSLPDDMIEHAKRFGGITHRNIEAVLTDALEMIWPTLGSLPDTDYPPISSLSDEDVLVLADSKMNPIQNNRLGTLQEKGKTSGLTKDERYELMALMQIYQLGQLRKSEAMAEAVQRGLRKPISE